MGKYKVRLFFVESTFKSRKGKDLIIIYVEAHDANAAIARAYSIYKPFFPLDTIDGEIIKTLRK